MAWNVHYTVPFKSIEGNDYIVKVYEWNYKGDTVTLTGAAEPFVTQEDDDDNIFIPIRTQSGYLRVIDETEDGLLMLSMAPKNNIEKLVQLIQNITDNGVTTEKVRWQGFLQAQSYSQSWDKNVKQVEFPVKSFLGALSDVSIQSSDAGRLVNFAYYIYASFTSLVREGGGITPYKNVHFMGDLYSVATEKYSNDVSSWLMLQSMPSPFFSTEEVANEGNTINVDVGKSWSEVLEDIMSFLGLTMREDGDNLYFCQYDGTEVALHTITRTWSDFDLCRHNSQKNIDSSDIKDVDMLSRLVFRGDNNTLAFRLGAKTAKIELSISEYKDLLDLPQATEDDSEVLQWQSQTGGVMYCQPHIPRTDDNETFAYKEYAWKTNHVNGDKVTDDFELVGDSGYEKCLSCSSLKTPGFDSDLSDSSHIYCGAFPCRAYYKPDNRDYSNIILANALFLVLQYTPVSQYKAVNIDEYLVYTIKTSYAVSFKKGQYLHVAFGDNIMNVSARQTHDQQEYLYNQKNRSYKLKCYMRCADKEWDGEKWVDATGATGFYIPIQNDGINIESNLPENTDLGETDGFFIPLDDGMEGVVTFGFFNTFSFEANNINYKNEWFWAHSHIITDFKFEILSTRGIVESSRTTNIYRQDISSGFSDDEDISLTIGTYNNNIYSPVFVRDTKDEMLQRLYYQPQLKSDDPELYLYGPAYTRPESHLLSRMVAQYKTSRLTLEGEVSPDIDITMTRYIYQGRTFMGICEEMNWRSDTETVKFLEVNSDVI